MGNTSPAKTAGGRRGTAQLNDPAKGETITPCPVPKARGVGVTARVPSPWWMDELRSRRLKRFPPPAEHTPMVECLSDQKQCRKFYPGYYMTGRVCEDCRQAAWQRYVEYLREHGMIAGPLPTGKSNAEQVREALELMGAKFEERELPTEDVRVLRAQIQRYLDGKPTSLMKVDFRFTSRESYP